MPTPGEASGWDSSRFTSKIAWHRYRDNIQLQNSLPERNVELALGMFELGGLSTEEVGPEGFAAAGVVVGASDPTAVAAAAAARGKVRVEVQDWAGC